MGLNASAAADYPWFRGEQHRQDAEQCKASHEGRHPVEAAAEGADQKPGDQRAGAGGDTGVSGAEPDRGRADVGREQLGQRDRVAGESPNTKKPKIDRTTGYHGS
jgi:hypothetical protein